MQDGRWWKHMFCFVSMYNWFYMDLRSEFDQKMATTTYLKAQGTHLSIKIIFYAQVRVFIKFYCLLSDSFGWVPFMFLSTICFSSDGGGRGVTIPPNYLIQMHVTPLNPVFGPFWTPPPHNNSFGHSPNLDRKKLFFVLLKSLQISNQHFCIPIPPSLSLFPLYQNNLKVLYRGINFLEYWNLKFIRYQKHGKI